MIRLTRPSIRFACLALLSLGMLTGCGGTSGDDAATERTLRVAVIDDLTTPNPYAATTGAERLLAAETQRGLVTLDAAGRIVPGLAESWWVSEDGLSYIFRLRLAHWQDGKTVTPDDVVRAFRAMLGPASRHPLREELSVIENADKVRERKLGTRALGVKAVTENVVEIVLERPLPAMLGLLADPTTGIVRSVQEKGQRLQLGLGPYRLTRREPGNWLLDTNGGSFAARGLGYGHVLLSPAASADAAIARFRDGKVDIVAGGALDGLSGARTLPASGTLRIEPSYGVYGLVAQTRRGPLADIRLRRALAMAVDRENLVQRLFSISAMKVATAIVPPNLPSYGAPAAPDWAAWTPVERQQEARRLLTEAGFGPDTPLTLTVALPDGIENEQVLAAIAANWQALGVQITARRGSRAAMAALVATGEFDLALRPIITAADLPSAFLAPYLCNAGAINFGGYCNAEADRLLGEATHIADRAARTAKIKAAEKLMADEAPVISLFVPVRWSLVRADITGWVDNVAGSHPLSQLHPDGGK